jgi:hypothetical protein
MRVEQSLVALSAARTATVTDETHSTMEAWVGQRPQRSNAVRSGAAPAAIVNLTSAAIAAEERKAAVRRSTAALAQQALCRAAPTARCSEASSLDASDPTLADPNLTALIAMIERLTGRKVHVIRASDIPTDGPSAQPQAEAVGSAAAAQQAAQPAPQGEGWGVEVHIEQIHAETESTAFAATGQVVTADGRTINFDYQALMARAEYNRVTTDILAGHAARKIDPIALRLDGAPVALDGQRAAFDLDSDGTTENIAMPSSGTFFLALDRDGNGTIDNGSELFGPTSGNGFGELRMLDTDGNGWLDEGDAAYATLRLWSAPGAETQSLAQAGIGALYVGASVGTQFELRSNSHETLGQVVSSSVYLTESGLAGALQQVDLTA